MDKMSLLREHLGQAEIMQLATAVNHQPWACTLHFLYAPDGNVYWMSLPSRRHSQDLAHNPRAAVAVAIRTSPPIVGVQIDGDVTEVTEADMVAEIARQFAKRHGRSEQEVTAALSGSEPHVFYCLKPRTFVLFDKQNFPDAPRQEWQA